MNGVSATIAIDGVLIACLLLAVLLLLLALFDGGRRADEAIVQFDEPLPEYEADVPVDQWDDPAMDRHIATAIAVGHGADAVAIQRSIERSQAAVKGLLADRDELAKRRAGRR